MFTISEIIDLAIRVEKNGGKIYSKAQQEVTDTSVASTLEWLAKDEIEHEKWFMQLKEKLVSNREDPKMEEMARQILQGVLGDRAFSIEEADFSNLRDLRALLELSIEFEEDTVLFYEMLSGFIEDEMVASQLTLIIEEEKSHARRLKEILQAC